MIPAKFNGPVLVLKMGGDMNLLFFPDSGNRWRWPYNHTQ